MLNSGTPVSTTARAPGPIMPMIASWRSHAAWACLAIIACLQPLAALELHVDPQGDDRGAGRADHPFASIAAAQSAARAARIKTPGDAITVVLHRGIYYLAQPLVLGEEDAGTASAPTTIQAAEGEQAVISGGMRLALSWKPWRDGILQAQVLPGLELDQLFVDGRRQPMARYPNVDPSVAQFNGFAADAFSPARAARWHDPRGGFIHVMQSAEWGDYHYLITGKDAENRVSYVGGWQNNRQIGMHDRYRMVENIFEELDAPGEWFLDTKASVLYFMPPAGVDCSTALIEGVRLRQLVELRGIRQRPVRFITLRGLTFRHAERTFMETKEPLLRSDWTIFRGAALFFTGCEDCTVSDCTFDQLGGNAIAVSGYNRRVAIRGCRIDQAGASGVVFLGEPSAVRNPLFEYGRRQELSAIDRTPGPRSEDYPAGCLVDDCLIHATGRVEKQTAGVEIDMASRITVRDCTIDGVPRAGINIGDGCWGGHVIEGCDVFDTVLETGDHGSFNSWGRDRWWGLGGADPNTFISDGHQDLPLLDAVEPTYLRNNRWRCDHGWDIDLDDGSSNYRITGNLCLHGGIKLREGFFRVLDNNVMVGNSFHPHVWFRDSEDEVRHNIVWGEFRPIGMPTPWGRECDFNLIHLPGAAVAPALRLQRQSGRDAGSLQGDAHFIDPQHGDYRVASGSPALSVGFANVPMERYGVRSPRLRALAGQPRLPGVADAAAPATGNHRDGGMVDWLGARLKNVVGLGEVSATGLPGETGVLVLDVDGAGLAATAGLAKLDVISKLDGRAVDTLHDLLRAYAGSGGHSITVTVWRAQHEAAIEIPAGYSTMLSPAVADKRGAGASPRYDAEKDFLGSWTNAHLSLAWAATLPAGAYDVALLLAAESGSAGSTFRVVVGSAELTGTVPDSGGWESFSAVGVGSLTVAGVQQVVELRPMAIRGAALMNLRAVVLTRRSDGVSK